MTFPPSLTLITWIFYSDVSALLSIDWTLVTLDTTYFGRSHDGAAVAVAVVAATARSDGELGGGSVGRA